ncbi:MAG: glycosyltransferase family 39 protein, partial [Allomuricauda sp.]
SVENIYKISDRHTWALDFYNQNPVNIISISDLDGLNQPWVYVTDGELQRLREAGYHWHDEITVDQFRITRLQLKFLNPLTRGDKLNKMHLVHLD